jgi:FAD/FMN-containing dehydrogenase
MHGDAASLVPLLAGLKRRYDPRGILNPGRGAGGL